MKMDMAEAWIYSRTGLTSRSGVSYGFTKIALNVNGDLIAIDIYDDDKGVRRVITTGSEYAKHIIEIVECFRPSEGWMAGLDLAVKTKIPAEKVNKILTLKKKIENLEEQLEEITQKINEAKSELYRQIEEIRREEAEEAEKQWEEEQKKKEAERIPSI